VRRGRDGPGPRAAGRGLGLASREAGGELLARRGDGGEHDELRDAAMCLVGVVGHDSDSRVGVVERPRHVRVLPERRSADDENGVVRREKRA
jgi:hypothetical protein